MTNRAPRSFRICCFGLLGCLVAGVAQAHGVVRFDNGLWYDGSTFQKRTVYSREGVLALHHEGDVDRVENLEQLYIIPPFGDAHSHALGGPDFNEEQQKFLALGIFYVANPNGILHWAREARTKAATPETVDVRHAFGGLTSSGGHPIQIYDGIADRIPNWSREKMADQAYVIVDDAAGLERKWPHIIHTAPDFLKVYLERSEHHQERKADPAYYGKRGLDPALLSQIVHRARASKLRVSAHVTSAFDFATAVHAGVEEMSHLPLERLTDAHASAAAKRGTTVVTTTLSHRPTDGIPDVDGIHRHNLKLLRRHGVRLVLGTDSHRSVVDEARNVAKLAGLSPAETLKLLTQITPRWIFPGRAIGALRADSEASFLVLKSNPLEDLAALDTIVAAVKAGHGIELKASAALPSPVGPLIHKTMAEGVNAAVAEYRRLRKEEADAWDFSESQLNNLGYNLMNHGRIEDAIVIFKLNVEMFPDAANTYDSLGEAYVNQGNRALAIRNYRRSLELNPHNDGARAKLKELSE